MQNSRVLFIPHAGDQYAGHARELSKKWFRTPWNVYQFKYIIFLATNHHSRDNFILQNNTYLDNIGKFSSFLDLNENSKEHSWEWVKGFLITFVPLENIISISTGTVDPNIVNTITTILENDKNKEILLVCTSDLTHYGREYHNGPWSDPQIEKQNIENPLIKGMIACDLKVVTRSLENNKLTACGKSVISMMIDICNRLKMEGRVCAYYDSSRSPNDNLVEQMTILYNNPEMFVSYLSMIFSNDKSITTMPITYDLAQLLSSSRAVIENTILGNKRDIEILELPSWAFFSNTKNGIFVGTKHNGKTNSSIGSYETENSNETTAHKILGISRNCVRDSRVRWRDPIDKSSLSNTSFHLNLLQNRKTWEKYPSDDAERYYKRDDNKGIYLIFKDGSAATYLPSVWQKMEKWTIEDLMDSLSLKAGVEKNRWKYEGTIYLYGTLYFSDKIEWQNTMV